MVTISQYGLYFFLSSIKVDYFIESAPYGFLFTSRKTRQFHVIKPPNIILSSLYFTRWKVYYVKLALYIYNKFNVSHDYEKDPQEPSPRL